MGVRRDKVGDSRYLFNAACQLIVVAEPADRVTMGVFNKNTPKKGDRFTPFDGSRFQEDPKKFYTPEFQKSAREKLARIRCPILLLKGDVTPDTFNREILIPELLDLGKSLVVLTYPREPHSFAFYSTPARTAATGGRRECVRGCQRPDAAASAHEAVARRPELDQAGAV